MQPCTTHSNIFLHWKWKPLHDKSKKKTGERLVYAPESIIEAIVCTWSGFDSFHNILLYIGFLRVCGTVPSGNI